MTSEPQNPRTKSPAAHLSGFAAVYKRLQELRFALRSEFQQGQTTPLKSFEEVREEMLSIASGESTPPALRAKIRDELNPQDEELKSMLSSASSEIRKEAGIIIIERVLEPSEATQFRKSPEYRDRVVSEYWQNQTAQGFDDIKRDDPAFFSYIIQTAHRANNTALKLPATTPLPVSREEQHNLLRKFSADRLGLSGSSLAEALYRGDWRKRYMSWLVNQDFKVRGARGAPKKAVAEMTRARWELIGKPKLTADVRDRLAEFSYPTEYARAKLYSKERKKLRDRVARQVRPLIIKAASAAPAT